MQISVSSTLTVYHDDQFWVGLIERVGDGAYGVARIVFGTLTLAAWTSECPRILACLGQDHSGCKPIK